MARFLAYFLPVLLFLGVDHLLGRQSYSFPNDNIPGQFGLGLNFLTAPTSVSFHHPAFPIIEIAGALVALFKGSSDLNGFFWAGSIVHVACAVAAACWMARLAALARLNVLHVALLSLVALSMPTVALYGPLLVSYVPVGLLLPPMAVAIYLIASRQEMPGWVAPSLYLVFGFQMSMLYSSAVLLIGLGAGLLLLLCSGDADRLPAFRAVWPKSASAKNLLLFVCFALLLRIVLGFLEVPGRDLLWVPSCALSGALLLLPKRYRRWWALQHAVVLPTVIGWLIGCNILVMKWASSAQGAFLNKGGASPRLPFMEVWQNADIPRFVTAWHWHWFMVAVAAAVLILWVSIAVSQKARRGPLPFVAVFATLALVLNVLIAADVSFLTPSNGWAAFGQESRYFIMMIAPVALMCVVGFLGSRIVSVGMTGIVSVLIVLSFSDYFRAAEAVWPEYRATEDRLERLLQSDVAASPVNTVWCLRVVQPSACQLLYGFNNYRVDASYAKLDRRSLHEGRVRYATSLESACDAPHVCDEPGRDLFIGDVVAPAGAEVVMTGPGIYAYRLTRPRTPSNTK